MLFYFIVGFFVSLLFFIDDCMDMFAVLMDCLHSMEKMGAGACLFLKIYIVGVFCSLDFVDVVLIFYLHL